MTKLRLAAAGFALTLLALPAAAAAAVQVRGVDASAYPTIRATVVTSKVSRTPPVVTENGGPVVGVKAKGGAMTVHRRRVKQTMELEQRLTAEARRLREQARLLAPGALRDSLLRKARQAETAAQMSGWLRSPGQQPPK